MDRRLMMFGAAVCVLATLAGCGGSQKRYALRGRVVSKSADRLNVNHGEIPGFMGAMTMPYPVKDEEAFRVVRPGDEITADLVVNTTNEFWLEHLVVVGKAGASMYTATETTDIEVEDGTTLVGNPVPDVPLVNQDGRTIHLSDFRGKTVLLTFIYTRCPFPTFCPLLTSEFASIHRELLKMPGLAAKTHLVSISMDPEYDRPPQLRKYGLMYLKNDASGFLHWDFVSTRPADLTTLAAAFGLTYYKDKNLITHTMRTVLVAPGGTVARIWDGGEWRKPELVDAIEQAATGVLKGD
jgi:protein SCO1/2